MYKKLFCIRYSDENLFTQIYRLWACARANLVSGINKSNKSACAIYLILDKINSISPVSCHYITREQAYSGNEIARATSKNWVKNVDCLITSNLLPVNVRVVKIVACLSSLLTTREDKVRTICNRLCECSVYQMFLKGQNESWDSPQSRTPPITYPEPIKRIAGSWYEIGLHLFLGWENEIWVSGNGILPLGENVVSHQDLHSIKF
jgi:hypothetical protein